MEWLYKLLPRSDFAKNVFTLSIGAALAQIITLVITIFLARIYLPAQFGTLSIFISIINVFLVFSTGKYDLAIVVAKGENESMRLVQLSLIITILFGLLIVLFVTLTHFFPISIYRGSEVNGWLVYIPLSVIFLSGTQVFSMQNVREKSFKILSYTRVLEALLVGGSALIMVNIGTKGLLFSTVIGQLCTFAILSLFYLKTSKTNLFSLDKLALKKIAKDYSIFPKTSIIQSFVDIFQMSAIILIGSYFFNSEILGYYAICMRVLQAPMSLIIKPIANVFFSEASTLYNQGRDLYSLTKRTALKTFMLLIPILVVIGLFGPFLFSFVFGIKWREAGVYAQIFSPWIIADLVRSPISQMAYVVGQQKKMLLYTTLGSLLLLISIIFTGLYIGSIYNTFMIISFLQTAYMMFLIFMFIKIAKYK